MKIKYWFIIVVLCFAHCRSFAQTNPVSELMHLFDNLDKWDEKQDDNKGDSLESINHSIEHLLIQNPALLGENFEFDSYGRRMLTSEDKKIRIYCWDDRLGGTMRYAYSVMHYKGKHGYVSLDICKDTAEDPPTLCPFYRELYTFNTKKGDTVYISITQFVFSTGAGAFTVEAFKLVGDSLAWDVPFFQTRTKTLGSINYEYDISYGGPNRSYEGSIAINISKETGELFIPLINDRNKITGNFLKYIFNGEVFKYEGIVSEKELVGEH